MASRSSRKIAKEPPAPIAPSIARSDDLWVRDPTMIRRFIEQRPHYEQLGTEVAYALTKMLADADIKAAAITSRAKTLESFLEKIQRKSYGDPFAEITDLSGVRVVCYYADDLPKIEALIRAEFKVVERADKSEDRAFDRFGYSATHFLVHLGKRASGARYDDLKDKVCEIQARTVLQDAWAIFSHHLMYKHENDIPDSLKREIHALAGALATADTAFQSIRDKRDVYIKSVAASSTSAELASVELNLDSLTEYLAKHFPSMPAEAKVGRITASLPVLQRKGYHTLLDVERLLKRTEKAREWLAEQINARSSAAVHELNRALGIVHQDILKEFDPGSDMPHFQKAHSMVTRGA